MTLYLVRHGEAKPKWQDPDRPLTDGARIDIERIALFAKNAGVKVAQIRHSGKTRTEQTAAILAQHLNPDAGSVAITGLAPNDDVETIADALYKETDNLMLVGHLPFLDRLASQLLTGNPEKSIVKFQTASFVCLENSGVGWRVDWMVTPQLFTVDSGV